MDYERGADAGLGDEPNGSEMPSADNAAVEANNNESLATSGDDSAQQSASGGQLPTNDGPASLTPRRASRKAARVSADEMPPANADPLADFDTDADIMDDAFSSGPRPPEWPAADFENPDALEVESDAADAGDDSDAPILAEAAEAAAATVASQVRAESVNVSQAGVQSIEADSVNINQGGAGNVRAESMTVDQGGVGLARVGNLTLGSGSSAFAVVADAATVEQGANTFLVVSRSFKGEVQPTVDWRAALAFGAGIGLILSIFRRRR